MKIVKRNMVVSFVILNLIHPITAFSYFMEGNLLKVPLLLYAGVYFTLSLGSATAYILAVYYRLECINEVLHIKLDQSTTLITVKSVNQSEHDDTFVGLSQIYSALIDICDDINLSYGFQTMLGFGIIYFYTLLTTFTAYTDIVNERHLTPITISSIAFCIYYNFFLASVIFTCSMLDKEVRESFTDY
jgi:7tm Chemosensory receptor